MKNQIPLILIVLILGLAGNAAANEGWDGLTDDVRIYDYVLSDTQIEALTTSPTTSNPSPSDGSVIPGDIYPPTGDPTHIYTKLEFTAGDNSVKHTGYFSDVYAEVLNRVQDANLGQPPYPTTPGFETTYFVGMPLIGPHTDTLVRGTRYYWCIDETDSNDKGVTVKLTGDAPDKICSVVMLQIVGQRAERISE